MAARGLIRRRVSQSRPLRAQGCGAAFGDDELRGFQRFDGAAVEVFGQGGRAFGIDAHDLGSDVREQPPAYRGGQAGSDLRDAKSVQHRHSVGFLMQPKTMHGDGLVYKSARECRGNAGNLLAAAVASNYGVNVVSSCWN